MESRRKGTQEHRLPPSRTVFIPSAGRRTVPKDQAAHAPPGGDAAGSTGSAGSRGCRKKAPPGRAGSLTPAWGRFEAQGGVTRTLENQHIKVQIAHTCVPLALRSTARAHFSFMGKTGDQHESPELTDRISGPREAEEEKVGCWRYRQEGGSCPR